MFMFINNKTFLQNYLLVIHKAMPPFSFLEKVDVSAAVHTINQHAEQCNVQGAVIYIYVNRSVDITCTYSITSLVYL